MKFVSKNLNYRIVLQPSIPAVALSGQPGKAGVYVKFENGLLTVEDDDIVQKLLNHEAYNKDFVAVEDDEQATFVSAAHRAQQNAEPEHDITQIEYGHVGKALNPKAPIRLTPEVQKYLTDLAAEMATRMVKQMMTDRAVKAAAKETAELETTPAAIEDKEPSKAKTKVAVKETK